MFHCLHLHKTTECGGVQAQPCGDYFAGFQVTGGANGDLNKNPIKSLGLEAKPQKIPWIKLKPQKIPY